MGRSESGRPLTFKRLRLMEQVKRVVLWAYGPRASLALEVIEGQPCPGGALRVRVTLVPQERLKISGATLELVYAETRFVRTVLDGYQEHTTDRVHVSEKFLHQWDAEAGVTICREVRFRLPEEAPRRTENRPTRGEWQVRAKVDLKWRPNMRCSRMLADLTPGPGGAPDVEGKAILPWDLP